MQSSYKALFEVALPSDNQTFINSVMKKTTRKTPAKRLNMRFATAAVALAATLTLTAAAINDWHYSELVQHLFGNNEKILYGMHGEINYKVTKNTFKGITFEMTGLYVDNQSIFFAVDIISEKPIFEETENNIWCRSSNLLSGKNNAIIAPGFLRTKFYFQNEYRLTAVYYTNELVDKISINDQYTLNLNGLLSLLDGEAKIRFNINKLAEGNDIQLKTNIEIPEADVIITEIKINPFSIWIFFDGNTWICNDTLDNIALKSHEGEIITKSDNSLFIIFKEDKENEKSDINVIFNFESTIDIDDLAAVLYKGIEIPLR